MSFVSKQKEKPSKPSFTNNGTEPSVVMNETATGKVQKDDKTPYDIRSAIPKNR